MSDEPLTSNPVTDFQLGWDAAAKSYKEDIERLTAELKKLDPDPVVCGCREAGCPHTPIAQLPRQALVDHFKARIRELEQRLQSETTGEQK